MVVPSWGWAGLGGLVVGGALVGLGMGSYIRHQRAALQQYQDSVQVVHTRDSTAFSVRDSTVQVTVRHAIDSTRAVALAETVAASERASQARRDALHASHARDSALVALGLTADQLTGVQAAVAASDSAHAKEVTALVGETASVRYLLTAEIQRSAQLMRDTTDVRAELRKRDAMIAGLNARITQALKPVGFGVTVKGGVVGLLVGAGGTCLLTQCWKPR